MCRKGKGQGTHTYTRGMRKNQECTSMHNRALPVAQETVGTIRTECPLSRVFRHTAAAVPMASSLIGSSRPGGPSKVAHRFVFLSKQQKPPRGAEPETARYSVWCWNLESVKMVKPFRPWDDKAARLKLASVSGAWHAQTGKRANGRAHFGAQRARNQQGIAHTRAARQKGRGRRRGARRMQGHVGPCAVLARA